MIRTPADFDTVDRAAAQRIHKAEQGAQSAYYAAYQALASASLPDAEKVSSLNRVSAVLERAGKEIAEIAT